MGKTPSQYAPQAQAQVQRFRLGFKCWRCGSRATAMRQETLSPILIELDYQCTNVDCGHTFSAILEAVRTLNPGAYSQPPGLNVPLSEHIHRRALLAEIKRGHVQVTPNRVQRIPVTDDLFADDDTSAGQQQQKPTR